MKKIVILFMLSISFYVSSQEPSIQYFTYLDVYDTQGLANTENVLYTIETDIYSWNVEVTNHTGTASFHILDTTLERNVYNGMEYVTAQMRNNRTYEMVRIYLFQDVIMISEGEYEYVFYNKN